MANTEYYVKNRVEHINHELAIIVERFKRVSKDVEDLVFLVDSTEGEYDKSRKDSVLCDLYDLYTDIECVQSNVYKTFGLRKK